MKSQSLKSAHVRAQAHRCGTMAKAAATHTPPVNVNHMCLLQGQMVVYSSPSPSTLVPFHKLLQSLPPLCAFTHSLLQHLSLSHGLCLSLHRTAEEI